MPDTSPEIEKPGSFNSFEQEHPDMSPDLLRDEYTQTLVDFRKKIGIKPPAPTRTVLELTVLIDQ